MFQEPLTCLHLPAHSHTEASKPERRGPCPGAGPTAFSLGLCLGSISGPTALSYGPLGSRAGALPQCLHTPTPAPRRRGPPGPGAGATVGPAPVGEGRGVLPKRETEGGFSYYLKIAKSATVTARVWGGSKQHKEGSPHISAGAVTPGLPDPSAAASPEVPRGGSLFIPGESLPALTSHQT